jgi:hypothetical protein
VSISAPGIETPSFAVVGEFDQGEKEAVGKYWYSPFFDVRPGLDSRA